MNCLCCGKPIINGSEAAELAGWHEACIRKFFGTSALPELNISEEVLVKLADESTGRGFTVPGVQKKISLHLESAGRKPRLTLINYPTGYILKPQTGIYEALPEAEYLVMQMAAKTGISTVPFALIYLDSSHSSLAYITKRIDRILPARSHPGTELLAMEDFCQLDQRMTEDKYRGSYERCSKVISRYSQMPGIDLSELFLRIVFSFVTGNSDMHLKNFSLIETAPGNQKYVLSPAYDMLPVNVIVPEDTEQLALTLNGKKHNIHRNDFLKFAAVSGIPHDAACKMIDKIQSMKDTYLSLCAESYLPDVLKERFSCLIEERTAALESGRTL